MKSRNLHPLFVAGDARAQEEMLKAVPALAELGSLSKDELAIELLPRVCGVCLATTSAPVRTAAVQAMGRLVKLVDDEQAAKMLATCQQARLTNRVDGDYDLSSKSVGNRLCRSDIAE